jgi:hypothetical protein
MEFDKMAQHFLYANGALARPKPEDAEWLTGGETEEFTEAQLEQITAAVKTEREKQRRVLINDGVLFESDM